MRFSITLLFAAAAAVVAQDTVSVTAGGECEPHSDHWHCPDGVPEPTTPPTPEQLASHSAEEAAEDSTPASTIASTTATVISSGTMLVTASPSMSHSDEDDHDHEATASTCEPHGDHWHCPDGVTEPTVAPDAAVSGTATVTESGDAASAAESAAPEQTENAAAPMAVGRVAALVGAAAAAYFL